MSVCLFLIIREINVKIYENFGTKSVIMSDIMVYLDMFRVKKEVVKQVQGLRKGHLKHYCKFAHLLASQREYMVAVYQ